MGFPLFNRGSHWLIGLCHNCDFNPWTPIESSSTTAAPQCLSLQINIKQIKTRGAPCKTQFNMHKGRRHFFVYWWKFIIQFGKQFPISTSPGRDPGHASSCVVGLHFGVPGKWGCINQNRVRHTHKSNAQFMHTECVCLLQSVLPNSRFPLLCIFSIDTWHPLQ